MINACHHEQFPSNGSKPNENRFITVILSTTLSLLVLKYGLSIIALKKVANNYPQKKKFYVKDFFSKLDQIYVSKPGAQCIVKTLSPVKEISDFP